MAFTPLYKRLKNQGTTVYAFPGAAEDYNQAQRNDSFTMRFSKFALLNLPSNNSKTWNFDKSFWSSQDATESYSDAVIESLRNYVANQEITIRNTRTSSNEFLYDNSVLSTPTEKIFFKWLKKLGLIEFEPATPNDDYFPDLPEFLPNNINDEEFLPEFLWKERSTNETLVSDADVLNNQLRFTYSGTINYKVGDKIQITNGSITFLDGSSITLNENSDPLTITEIDENIVVFNQQVSEVTNLDNLTTKLVYNKLVRYVGEITSDSNISLQSQFYQQVYMNMADNAGQTPDILFRTTFDDNYAPDLRYPLLPSQFQAEIIGAEDFSSPIVSRPQDFPGTQYAQFDNDDSLEQVKSLNYINASGDILRRSGDYFGTSGEIDDVEFNSNNLDGIGIDFNYDHYVKMNIPGNEVRNFDEFNALYVNNEPPKDFEFNAILWYYEVEDANGNVNTNLYGISFLDNPKIDPKSPGERFPVQVKYVNTGEQDGTSYAHALNLDTMLSSDNPKVIYNPDNVNNLFGMNLYNEAMRRLAISNDSFMQVITRQNDFQTSLDNIKQLVYTQTDINTIRRQISRLDDLLRLYSTNQIVSSESIEVDIDTTSTPPEITLNAIEGRYRNISNILTTDLYSPNGITNVRVNVPNGKDFMINVENNDDTIQSLNDNLNIIINRDLDFKQTADIIITGLDNSTQNKKLDIKLSYVQNNNVPQITNIISNIELPIFYNTLENESNSALNLKQIYINVNSITLTLDQTLKFEVDKTNGLKNGDCILLNNIIVDGGIVLDTQVIIDEVISTTEFTVLYEDYDSLNDYVISEISNGNLSPNDQLNYNSIGYISFNKGIKFSITRIDDLPSSTIEERYKIIRTEL